MSRKHTEKLYIILVVVCVEKAFIINYIEAIRLLRFILYYYISVSKGPPYSDEKRDPCWKLK